MTTTDHTLQKRLLELVAERTLTPPRVRRLASGHDDYMHNAKSVCVVRAFHYETFDETVVEVITRTKPSAMPTIRRFQAPGDEFPTDGADHVAQLIQVAS